MRFMHLQIYLLMWCQAVETLHNITTHLGQNVTINCDLDGEIYWLLLKAPDFPMMILRTLSNTSLFFNTKFRLKYSQPSKKHLFINNITSDELGVYYCMKTGTPPKFSSGTRLHVHESTNGTKQVTQCMPNNHTAVENIEQKQTLWKSLTIILGLLNGVLFIVIIGLLKVFVVGNKQFGKPSQQFRNTELQQAQVLEQLQDPNQLQYAEVDFTKLRKKAPANQQTRYHLFCSTSAKIVNTSV